MGLVRLGLELRVALHAEEPRVALQLGDLHQAAFRVPAADDQAGLLEAGEVIVIHLEAVTVALGHDFLAVGLARERAGLEFAVVSAEPHRAALQDNVALLVHQRDDRVRRFHIELDGVGVFQPQHVARELDDRDLQPEAQAVIGNPVFPRVAGGGDLALDAPVAKAAGDQNTVELLKFGQPGLRLEVFGVDADDFHARLVGDAGVAEGFVDGFIGVLQLDVFADHADLHLVLGRLDAADDLGPDILRVGAGLEPELVHDELIKALLLQHEGQLVDG